MSGPVLAALSALSFSGGAIANRRAVVKVRDAEIGILITVPLGAVFFLLVLTFSGRLGAVADFPWQGYCWLGGAGVIHFVGGRSLSYQLLQLVGANVSAVVRRVQPVVTVILGVTLLGEPLGWTLAVGVSFIVGGLMVVGLNPRTFRSGQGLFSGIPPRAYLLAVGVGLTWGTSPIMIKLGLNGGSPVAAAFISYAAATVVALGSLSFRNRKANLLSMQWDAVGFFCVSGTFSTVAQLARYYALSSTPASVVSSITATAPVFIFLLSFVFNRKLEVFTINVVAGIVVVVIGSILVAQ